MVNRSGGLKNKKDAGPDKGGEDAPVYPFEVDVPSMPERRYIAGVNTLARIGFVSMIVSIILSAFLVLRALSLSSSPYFMYWDARLAMFRFMPQGLPGSAPSASRRLMYQDEYLTEYFAREYIRRTFEISPTLADNEAEWCGCSGRGDASRGENAFDPDVRCFVCNFSTPQIYASFAAHQRPRFMRLAESGIRRSVGIIDVERIRRGSPPGDSSFFDMLVGLFFSREKPVPIYTEYRIDFVLEDRFGTRVRYETMRAHMVILSYQDDPTHSHGVIAISYMFEPADAIATRMHIERRQAEAR
jgi:hypothetical protein